MRAAIFALFLMVPCAAQAQDLRALAQLDQAASRIADTRGGVEVTLALSQAVPWRVIMRENPHRVILDFREVGWAGVSPEALDTSDRVETVRVGSFRPGWSRMVLELDRPLIVDQAGMITDTNSGTAVVTLALKPSSAEAFAEVARASAPQNDLWALPEPAVPSEVRDVRPEKLLVVLDPGHGGIDPGAQRDGLKEADLMLTFARELEEVLIRRGGYRVLLTRSEDIFVPLAERVALARAAKADVFLSLHADAIAEGNASGATVYTLSEHCGRQRFGRNGLHALGASEQRRVSPLGGPQIARRRAVERWVGYGCIGSERPGCEHSD